jgi:hypothetical protein
MTYNAHPMVIPLSGNDSVGVVGKCECNRPKAKGRQASKRLTVFYGSTRLTGSMESNDLRLDRPKAHLSDTFHNHDAFKISDLTVRDCSVHHRECALQERIKR